MRLPQKNENMGKCALKSFAVGGMDRRASGEAALEGEQRGRKCVVFGHKQQRETKGNGILQSKYRFWGALHFFLPKQGESVYNEW